ncbi:MAG: c-type cytochrome, partial [Rhodocyclaceae bacterium]
ECFSCHGRTGRGRGKFPMLVGQYTNYLMKQVDAYIKGERPHDEEGTTGILNRLGEKDIRDILAYLTSIQDSSKAEAR